MVNGRTKSTDDGSTLYASTLATKGRVMTDTISNADTQSESTGTLPWTLSVSQALEHYNTSEEDGLASSEAESRLSQYGDNALEEEKGVSLVGVFVRQVCNAMVMVFIVCMALAFGISDWIAGGVMGAVVVINVVVGFLQEYSAEKTMAALRSLSSPTARVIRDGNELTVPSKTLVPGDIILVSMGDTVPADGRVLSGINFETDEALLTGESLPVAKEINISLDRDIPVGDRTNMVFSSSVVSKGRATIVVTGTGMSTEIGKIANSLKGDTSKVRKVKRDDGGNARKRDYARAFFGTIKDLVGAFLGTNQGTPLHRLLAMLAVFLFFVAVLLAIIAMSAQKFDVNREVAIYAIAAAVSMIPASLVVVLTITMAMGAKAMVQRHVIVRKMNSLEALGSVNDICSDKTGTLTQGRMLLRKAWIPSAGKYEAQGTGHPFDPTIGEVVHLAEDGSIDEKSGDMLSDSRFTNWLTTASLANVAVVREHVDPDTGEKSWKANGDPTEIACQVFVHRLGYQRAKIAEESGRYTHLVEFPFDSTIKRMSSVYHDGEQDQAIVFAKGAVERVLGTCTKWYGTEGSQEEIPLEQSDHQTIFDMVDTLASEGLRVLAFAYRPITDKSIDWSEVKREDAEHDLSFLGLAGIYDPPRDESAQSVALCHEAGINVRMLTGDHPATAQSIAIEVGILPRDFTSRSADETRNMVMPAPKFDALTDAQIDAMPELPRVIARCAPETKVRMIDALHRRGAFTAMTGDGVNDSPSLKKADVGIAMGMAGSDVAKDAADIVLSDDNFASIVSAVEEGRRMTDNIQKFALHLLAGNVGQVLVLMIGLAFKDDEWFSVFPLAPVEVLYIIMITSAFPALGLGVERAEPDIMQKPPKDPKSAIFTWEVIAEILVMGSWLGVICLVAYVGIVYGKGDGYLGENCNSSYSESCKIVFEGRSTIFAIMTWGLLFLAWELIDRRRSMFYMTPGAKNKFTQFFKDVYRNQILFWSVIGGFVTVFPIVYIPVINKDVFLHAPISWEWAVSIGGLLVYIAGLELWKWIKRVYYRRQAKKADIEHGLSAPRD